MTMLECIAGWVRFRTYSQEIVRVLLRARKHKHHRGKGGMASWQTGGTPKWKSTKYSVKPSMSYGTNMFSITVFDFILGRWNLYRDLKVYEIIEL